MFSHIYSKEFNVLYYKLIMGLIGDILSLSYSIDKSGVLSMVTLVVDWYLSHSYIILGDI